MMNRIVFDFPLAFYAGLPLAVAVLMLSAWSQLRRGIGIRWVAFSVAFRGAALLILILLVARPVRVEAPDKDKQRNTVLLLADRSSSMSLEDGEMTRFRHLLTFTRDALLPALKRVDLRPRGFLFAEDAVEAGGAQLAAAMPDGRRTNLSGAITQALASTVERPLAVIALTDGAVNVQRDNARALTALLESGVPLIGIGFGSETDVRTLSLRRAISPPYVHPNQEFHLSVQLEMSGVREMPPFDLLLLRDGQLLKKKTVSAGKGQRLWLEHFAVREENQGVYTYTVQLQPPVVEGLRCLGMLAATRVRVLRGKDLRVLYCQGAPNWNYKFIRLALRGDPTIKLTGLTRTSTRSIFHQDVESPGELAGGFPSTLEEIAAFRVVVLSNFKPADLTSNQQELLKRFCGEFGGGVLMIGGTETFGSSWRNSQLEQLLPVRFAAVPPTQESTRPLSRGRSRPRTRPYADSQSVRESLRLFGLQLTDAALDHPVFQISDSGTQRAAWAELPRFTQYARVEAAKLGAQVWAVNPDDIGQDGRPRVLIAQQRYGAGISAVICMRDLWHWRLAKNSDPQRFDRFWQQLFRYFSEAAGEEVAIRFPDQDLRPKADIRAIISRRPDPQNPEAARDYQVQIEDAQKKRAKEETIELTPGRSVEVRFQAETAGIYTVKVLEANYTPQASRTVEIREANIEFQHAARDMENLRQWASLTGGIAVKVEDCDDAGELVAQIKVQAERPSAREAQQNASGSEPLGPDHTACVSLCGVGFAKTMGVAVNTSTRPSKSSGCHATPVSNTSVLRRGDKLIPARRNAMRITVLSFVVLIGVLAQPVPASGQEMVLIRLKYTVDHSARPNDWNAKGFARVLYNVSEALSRTTSVKAAKDPNVLTLEDPDIFSYPFLFMTGHYGPILNEREIANLREHLTKGGFLLATSCCGNESFTKAFEREMKKVFPDKELNPLPLKHPVFHTFYTIEKATCFFGASETNERIERPLLRGIDIEGRTVVILSPYALTCGWTRRATCISSCKRFATEDAFKIGINVIIYALTH